MFQRNKRHVKNIAVYLTVLFYLFVSFTHCSLPAYAVVPTTNSTSIATGDGSTSVFTFTFELLQAADMNVYVNSILQTQGTAYTVTPAGGSYPCTGGSITFQSGYIPTNTSPILMARNLTLTQTISLPVEGDLPSSTLQTVFDRTCMQVQQLNTSVGLCVQLPITEVGLVSTALPAPVANNVIGWNSSANAITNFTPQQIVANVTGVGSGNVIGPATSTIGHLATFNNGTGTLLSDLAPGASGNVATSNGLIWTSAAPASTAGFTQLRAYLVSGSPEANGSPSGNSTLYIGPELGNLVTTDNGSGVLTTRVLTEQSQAITATSGSAYSVYLKYSSGWVITQAQDWTNPTTAPSYSTDALGRLTKSGDTSNLLVATYYADGTNLVYDWSGERSLSNEYNVLPRNVFAQDTTASWTYSSTTFHAADANTTNGQGRVTVFARDRRNVFVTCFCASSNTTQYSGNVIGIGLNSTSTAVVMAAATVPNAGGIVPSTACSYGYTAAAGLNYYQRLEAVTGNTGTFYYTFPVAPTSNGCNALVGTVFN